MDEALERSGWGNKLPTEILEVILSQLPLSHLYNVASTVCHHWAAIIRKPAFLPWKKLYHQAKVAPTSLISSFLLYRECADKKETAQKVLEILCDRHDVKSLPFCLVSIIRLMGLLHKTPPRQDTLYILCHHPMYSAAMATLQNMDTTLIPRPHNIWHIATTIIILCHDVWQVDTVVRLLLHPGSPFTSYDVVEAFYSLAAFLFHCTTNLTLPSRYHYIVYYVLYLYENEWAGTPTQDPGILRKKHIGQQSLTKFLTATSNTRQHTHEQMQIINHDIQPHHVLKIVAFAGTGKTTTLLQFCKQRPHQRFLLVVYNKSVQEYCCHNFPSNTTTRTAHSLAYAKVGYRYARINKLDGNINACKVASFLENKKGAGNRYRRAALVKNTVEKYLNSADDTITLNHVPQTDKKNERLCDDFRLKVLLSDAESVWNEMKKCNHNQQLSMSQDGQLKLWQVYKPKLRAYDIIMVDEAQDMNAAMFDIFLNQPCAKVIVGDPYQQIYSFRGAVNALDEVAATNTFHLTQSFRFGPEIGYMAQCVLQGLLGVHNQTLVGGKCHDTITAAPDPTNYFITQYHECNDINTKVHPNITAQSVPLQQNCKTPSDDIIYEGESSCAESVKKRMKTSELTKRKNVIKRAYIARTNLELYKMALKLCRNKKFDCASMTFVGGIEKYGFDTVMDVYKLSQVQAGYGTPETLGIKNKLIAKFKSVSNLKNFAENLDDIELYNKIMMYEYSGRDTANAVNLLKKRCGGKVSGGQVPDITFSTIHKAKGLEWDWVILLDDMVTNGILLPSSDDIGDEYNLLYVGITRAKRFLTVNSAALYTLTKANEKMEKLVSRNSVVEGTKCVQCGSCTFTNSSHPLLTQVMPLQISYGGDVFPGGYLCHTCSTFKLFVQPITMRHPPRRDKFMCDSSRLARRILIEGKACKENHNDNSNMERGWHKYALKTSGRQEVQPPLLAQLVEIEEEEEDFFNIVDDDVPEIIEIE